MLQVPFVFKIGRILTIPAQGSTVFVTVTVKTQVAMLPFASVALYVIVVVPTGKHEPIPKPEVGAEVTVTEGVEQLSAAVGAVHEALAQLLVVVKFMLVGQFVNVGAVASVAQGSTTTFVTVTVKTHVAMLPLASVALYVIVVVPTGKHEPIPKPEVGAEVTDTEGVVQLSVAVGAVHEALAQVPVVVKLMFDGQLANVGGVASVAQGSTTTFVTVTVKTQVAILPLASVALYVIVVVPTGKHEPIPKPEVGAEVTDTEGVPQLSVAVGAVHVAFAQLPVVVKLMFDGQLANVGGVASVSQGLATPQTNVMV